MSWETQQSQDDRIQQAIDEGAFRQALDALVRVYQHSIVGFCTNMLNDAAYGEEVAQEVFLAAYHAMPKFRQQASIRTWLFAIARKQCLKALRNRHRRRRLEQDKQNVIATEVHREMPGAPEDDPEARIQLVKQGLDKLPKTERALLLMRYDTGLLLTDMARIMRTSESSIRRRLAQAVQRLQEVIEHDAR